MKVEENEKVSDEEEDKKEKLMQETMDAVAQRLCVIRVVIRVIRVVILCDLCASCGNFQNMW